MQEQFKALIDALVDDADFRAAFMEATDRETRMGLAAEKGLTLPSEESMSAVTNALSGEDGEVPESTMSSAFWMSAFWVSGD